MKSNNIRSIIFQYVIIQFITFCFVFLFSQFLLKENKLKLARAMSIVSKEKLLNNDFRSLIIETNLIAENAFEAYQFLDKDMNSLFIIPIEISQPAFEQLQNSYLIYNVIDFPVIINGGTVLGAIRLVYNRFDYFKFTFLSWLLLVTISIPFLVRVIRKSVMNTIKQSNIEKKLLRAELSQQLAHDIRSPLAALDMGIKSLKNTTSSEVQLIRSAINRIHDIANNLAGKTELLNSDSVLHSTLLPSILTSMVSEKRTEYRDKSNIEIDFSFSSINYGLYSNVVPSELKRIISNLINNAVEAIGNEQGTVTLSLDKLESFNLIHVIDDGPGMTAEIKERIFEEGFSAGKADGTGIGLYHAREALQGWGGEISCVSSPGKGAHFIIKIPVMAAPRDFVASIKLRPSCEVIIVDDDSSIHQVWKGRFESLGLKDLKISTFSAPSIFQNWLSKNKSSNQLYLIDYEFLGSELTGLDLLNHLESDNAYLVTSRYEEEHIRTWCEKANVPLVDKSMIGFIPIETSETKRSVVLIDDDPIMHKGWEMEARNTNINLSCFETVEGFLNVACNFSKDSEIFVDSNLGDGLKGEVESKKIYDLGFKNIYLATGYSAKDIDRPEWIKEVRGKKPEFK